MPGSKSNIRFYFPQKGFSLSGRGHLKIFISSLFKNEKKKLGDLTIIFCSDDYLLTINRQFLKHDYYTDILTFEISEPFQPIKAEIYISVDRVRDNAVRFGSSLKNELHRVIFHGALHLCGYKDKKAGERLFMRKKEDKYLQRYFLPNVPRGNP
jgi:probable rRNA maturation factor